MLKNQTKLIDLDTAEEWKIDRRTRGQDVLHAAHEKPTQTWILILCNARGERRFVPEKRVFEWFRES